MPAEHVFGWIDIPEGQPGGGRYALTFDGWKGGDEQTAAVLNLSFTPLQFPGHGGQRPGADAVAAAAAAFHAKAGYPEAPESDPDTVY